MSTSGSSRGDERQAKKSLLPEIDARELSWWAEIASGYQGQPLVVAIAPGNLAPQLYKEHLVPAGSAELFEVFTPAVPMVPPKEVTLSYQHSGDKYLLQDEPEADSLFWTASAIEKFVFPYYAAHRLLRDDEWDALKDAYEHGLLTAILHVAPSRPIPLKEAQDAFSALVTTGVGQASWIPLKTLAQMLLAATARRLEKAGPAPDTGA